MYWCAHGYGSTIINMITVCSLDCVFVLDVSVSIGNDANFEKLTDFAVKVINAANNQGIDARYAVILFARHAWINFKISDDVTNVTEAITSIKYSTSLNEDVDHKGTNTPDSLDLLKEAGSNGTLGLRDNSDYNCVIFVTDGKSNTVQLVAEQQGIKTSGSAFKAFKEKQLEKDKNNTISSAKMLHESGVYSQIFAIGVEGNKKLSEDELSAIDSANDPILVEGFNETEISNVLGQIQNLFCDCEYKPFMYVHS